MLATAALPVIGAAQQLRVVVQTDSALIIATLPTCARPCTDSARVQWRYGSQYVTRVVPGGKHDTVRVARLVANSAYLDSARLDFVQLSGGRLRANIAAFVPPVPATRAAANRGAPAPAPATPVPATANAPTPAAARALSPGRYVVPALPDTMSVAFPVLTGKSRRVPARDKQ